MTQTHQLFSERDRNLIETSVYDPALEPRFNALSGCLNWNDEAPSGITSEAYGVLSSLWVARSLMHQGLTFSDHPINPEYSQRVWQQAVHEIPNWPGFKRLVLSEEDKALYAELLADENPFD